MVASPPKVVLITGASAGIGLATADRLHRAGWTVIGASRRGTTSGAGWHGLVMDVDSDASVAEGMATIIAEHGRLDALVLNAGWGVAGAVEDTPIAEAQAQFDTNLWGAVRTIQAALPTMRAHGDGRIVLITSLGGHVAIPFQAFYSASKFALDGFGEALAYEVAPFGIHVTMVAPGNVRTDFKTARRTVEPSQTYATASAKAIGVMEQDEATGLSPDKAARVIQKALDARRPPRRSTAGSPFERAGVFSKRLLPWRLVERAAKSTLGV